jgi:hypothetical protein
VARWEAATPQFFKASAITGAAITAASIPTTIRHAGAGAYELVTSTTTASSEVTNHYEAFVVAVYNDGRKSPVSEASQISTIDHNLAVSNIALVKDDTGADGDSNLIITFTGPDTDATTATSPEAQNARKL